MYDFSALPEIKSDYRVRLPNPREASKEGILAFGGNLSPGMLLSAYEQGIFPWFSQEDPVLWWSPDPRFVIYIDEIHISRRSRRFLRNSGYEITMDTSFCEVIELCAHVPRRGEEGTWITEDMKSAYTLLHGLGAAHSVEVWKGEYLVGGLYGVSPGRIFCGESMFSLAPNASRLALFALGIFLRRQNSVPIIDSQIANCHMESLGGRNISRELYLDILQSAVDGQCPGGWEEFRSTASELL